jgi:hypothetical protein
MYASETNSDEKEIVKMDKNRFEQLKGITQLEQKYATQLVFTMDDLKWLVEQVEKYEKALKDIIDLEKGIEEMQSFSYEQAEKVEELERVSLKTRQLATEQIIKLEQENELLKTQLKKARESRYNLGEGM